MTATRDARAFKVAALYKFVPLPDCGALRPEIADFCGARGIRGTILLAPEGVNGTIAGRPDAVNALVRWLETASMFAGRFRHARIKFSTADSMPFYRMKVRVKSEIVTLHAPEADPGRRVGAYVAPEDWNALIARDDVTLVDTRNDYEVGLGSFVGAIDPRTQTFTDFKRFAAERLDSDRDRKVAMFCTGGIRCEKASSYLLSQGFEEVFHLKGGILDYLATVPANRSQWRGECFVFDERVSLVHGLVKGAAELCRACRRPLTAREQEHPDFVSGIQCPHCAGTGRARSRRAAARQHQMTLAEARGLAHIGDDATKSARVLRAAKAARGKALRLRAG